MLACRSRRTSGGATGGSDEGYCKWMCAAAYQRGWRPVVMNFRGCNGLELTSPKARGSYLPGSSLQLKYVLPIMSSRMTLGRRYIIKVRLLPSALTLAQRCHVKLCFDRLALTIV